MKNLTQKEYISSLKSEKLPNWKDGWNEGFQKGREIPYVQSNFCKEHGVKNEIEFKMKQAEKGKLSWRVIMGLSSLDEQIKAMQLIEKFNNETGLSIHQVHELPTLATAIPKEKRENVAQALSFMLNEPEDWQKLAKASNIQACFNDTHIGSPNAYYNTINAVKTGNCSNGIFTQFGWSYDGCPNDIENIFETIKAVGVIASKYDEQMIVDSYMEDAIPAYFMDFASYLAFAQLEYYIIHDLCHARYAFGFGHYENDVIVKMAMWLTAHDLFSKNDQPGISFIQANSIDHWDQYLESNYGFLVPEALMAILVERKYKTGCSWLTIPITEKVAIPTLEAILNVSSACQRAEECADAYEKVMDFTAIEELRDEIKKVSTKMFNNIITGFKDAGIDITNPLEMLVVIKRMDPSKIEEFFHPSIMNEGHDSVKPLIPATLWVRSIKEKDQIVMRWDNDDDKEKLKNKKIITVSGDVHSFGKYVVTSSLGELGVKVIDGGVSVEPIDALDLADEYNINTLCISLHNGQALNYAKLITKLAEERGKKYNFYMGGVLNSYVNENDKEPSDVTGLLEEMGIYTSKNVDELLKKISE